MRMRLRMRPRGWMSRRSPRKEAGDEESEKFDFEEPPLTGETYPAAETPRHKDVARRRGPGTFLIVLFCVLGALLLAVVGYIVYRSLTGSPLELLPEAATESTSARRQVSPRARPTRSNRASSPAPSSSTGQSEKLASHAVERRASTSPQPPTPLVRPPRQPRDRGHLPDQEGRHAVGHLLHLLPQPWLYPRLAKANSIKNPDLIFAGAKIFIPED